MPFSITADDVFNQFGNYIMQNKLAKYVQAYTVRSAQVETYKSHYITSDGADRPINPIVTKLILLQLSDNQQNPHIIREVANVTRPELRAFFDFVASNTDSNYRNVKSNNLWRTLYGVRIKDFETYDSATNQKGIDNLEATYCQRCGVILPLRNLTIDHQKPQKGGETEAMLRVFRAAGLTESTGSGTKNRYLQRQIALQVGGNTTVLPRGQRGSNAARYTLSDKGAIYYSALLHSNQIDNMKQMSMHHIVNLRPMCGPCNSSLRNSNVTFWL